MRRFAAMGLSAALLTGGAACSTEKPEAAKDEHISLEVEQPNDVYTRPNVIHDPQAVTDHLKVGEHVVALCYFESATLGSDSVLVTTGHNAGFTFLWHHMDDTLVYTYGENPTQRLHTDLRACTPDETSGVLG